MGVLEINNRTQLGRYPTPKKIAKPMTRWAIEGDVDRILEPTVGDGVFLDAAYEVLEQHNSKSSEPRLYGVDIDPKVKRSLGKENCIDPDNLFVADILVDAKEKLPCSSFDVIVGNPPFLPPRKLNTEYHHFLKAKADEKSWPLPHNASLWSYVILQCVELLDQESGRMCMIAPIECLESNYAEEFRRYLSNNVHSVRYIDIEPKLFKGTNQRVVVIACSNERDHAPRYSRIATTDSLAEHLGDVNDTRKWTAAPERISEEQGVATLIKSTVEDTGNTRLGDIATIKIGIVTGDNEFFLVNDENKKEYGLNSESLYPIVRKTSWLKGMIYTEGDHYRLEENGASVYVYRPPDEAEKVNEKWLRKGREEGVPDRYKCKSRDPWYGVPLQEPPDAFLTPLNKFSPRVVKNSANVIPTNNFYSVAAHEGKESIRDLIVTLSSSFGRLVSEKIGKWYSSGGLKLTVGAAADIPVINLEASQEQLKALDLAYREGGYRRCELKANEVLINRGAASREKINEMKDLADVYKEKRIGC